VLYGKCNERQVKSGVLEGCNEKCTYPRLLSIGGLECGGTDYVSGVKDVARLVSSSGAWEGSVARWNSVFCSPGYSEMNDELFIRN